MTQPTIEQLIDILVDAGYSAKPSRDEQSVVIGFGPRGFARVTPDYAISHGEEVAAARVEAGKGVKGGEQAAIRGALNDAGIYARA